MNNDNTIDNHVMDKNRCSCVIWFIAVLFFILALIKIPSLVAMQRPSSQKP
jgi:type IV secretory pathway component VirB8